MRFKNGRVVAVVASVALLAIAGGTLLALRQGPRDGDGATGPLVGTTSGSPSAAPSTPATPSAPTPSTPGSPTSPASPTGPSTTPPAASGPAKVALKALDKLPRGRDPQVSYLSGREVRGGAGETVTIPGNGTIRRVVKLDHAVLAVQYNDDRSELVKVPAGIVGPGTVRTVPGVNSLAVSEDARSVAYAAARRTSGGGQLKGGTVYAETGVEAPRKLSRPNDWDLEVLAHAGGKVYFRSQESQDAPTAHLYAWTPGKSTATRVDAVNSPTAVSADGSVAASVKNLFDYGSCSTATQLATGKSLWRTCDYQIKAFSPAGAVAVGSPAYGDGYGPMVLTALDGRTGNLLREWRGPIVFHDVYAEDDDHLLIRVDTGPETKSAILRCAVSTGQCERATAVTSAKVVIGN